MYLFFIVLIKYDIVLIERIGFYFALSQTFEETIERREKKEVNERERERKYINMGK